MAGERKITELTEVTAVENDDVLVLVDTSANTTKKATRANVLATKINKVANPAEGYFVKQTADGQLENAGVNQNDFAAVFDDTDDVAEGSVNLYHTSARVLATVLDGLSLLTGTAITAADTVLSGLGKLQKQITDNLSTLTTHTGDTNNPHNVNKTQVGLSNVDNTSDANKPISSATQSALDGKQASLGFTPENSANKDTDTALTANSDTNYPSQKAVKTYVDSAVGGLTAADIPTDTTNFDNNLSSADDDLQKALDTLDELATGGGGGGSFDPAAAFYFYDDMLFLGNGTTAGVNFANAGSLFGANEDSGAGQVGTVIIATTSSAYAAKYLTMGGTGTINMPFSLANDLEFTISVRISDTVVNDSDYYFGFSTNHTAAPSTGLWVEKKATDTSLFLCNTAAVRVDTGVSIASIVGSYVRIRAWRSGATEFSFSLNGGTAVTLDTSGGTNTGGVNFFFGVSAASSARRLKVDFVEVKVNNLSR